MMLGIQHLILKIGHMLKKKKNTEYLNIKSLKQLEEQQPSEYWCTGYTQ